MSGATLLSFPNRADSNGTLAVYECGKQVPFDIRRVFTVRAGAGDVRGEHAHKECAQLLICVAGQVRVSCDDGYEISTFLLEGTDAGLLIPPGIWAKQEYLSSNSVLMVLCNRGYDAEDYLRDYDDFRNSLA